MENCCYPGCVSVLRKENAGNKFCSVHQRLLFQNEIIYKKRTFYREVASEKGKVKLSPICKWEMKQLKEGISLDYFYAYGRL